MPIPVSEVITQARELRPEFVERAHPDPTCKRMLVRFARALVAKVRPLAIDTVAADFAFNLPLADYGAGQALPAFQEVCRYGTVEFGQAKRRLTLVTAAARHASQHWPAFYVIDTTLYLAHEEADWNGATGATIRYVPQEPLNTPGTELLLPVEATDACVTALGHFLAQRERTITPGERGAFRQEAAIAEGAFLRQIGMRMQPAVNVVEDW